MVSTDSGRSIILVSWSILTFCSNGDFKILKHFEKSYFWQKSPKSRKLSFSNCFKILKSSLEQKLNMDHETRIMDLPESVETTQFCCCGLKQVILNFGIFKNENSKSQLLLWSADDVKNVQNEINEFL